MNPYGFQPLDVTFQDADFEHTFAACRSPLEGRSVRWMPFGMPRLSRQFARSVFFLYGRDPETGDVVGPTGTGVFVGTAAPGGRFTPPLHVYAITCAHVAPQGASIIRINTKDGKSRYIEFEPHEWEFIPGGSDVAAVDVTNRVEASDEVSHIPSQWLVGPQFIQQVSLGIGEDGFMLGMFANQPGLDQNMVAARFGNVSLLADNKTLIKHPNGNFHPAHIFDIRSRPGFSGSPVFVYRTPAGDLRNVQYGARRKAVPAPPPPNTEVLSRYGSNHWQYEFDTENNLFVALLGIHAGQYFERFEAKRVEVEGEGASSDAFRDGDMLKVPGSMTIVVPASEITKLLNQPTFTEQRAKRFELARKKKEDRNDPVGEKADHRGTPPAAKSEPPTTEDNPTHEEDFRRLVTSAAKTRTPDA